MLFVSQLCRNSRPLREAQGRLFARTPRAALPSAVVVARQMYTPVCRAPSRLIRIKELITSNRIFVRACSNAPRPAVSRAAVGLWLVGCSGMVFTAVALNGLSWLTETGVSAAAVLVPGAYLLWRGRLDRAMKTRLAVCCGILVAAQGRRFWPTNPDLPHTAHFQRVVDVGLAMALFTALAGGAARVLRPVGGAPAAVRGLAGTTALANTVKAMTIGTAVAGSLVAGLNAYARTVSDSPSLLPAPHKPLGVCTTLLATACWLVARRAPLSPNARRAANALAAMAWLQITLGVVTMLQLIPPPLKPSHKTGSLVLLSLATWLTHELKLIKYIPK